MKKTHTTQPARSLDRRVQVSRPDEITAALNRAKAIRLKREGLSYRAIGERLGVSHEAARGYVLDELAVAAQDARQDTLTFRELERARLESLLTRWLPIATAERLDVSGDVEKKGKDGETRTQHIELPDYLAGIKAAELVVKISARIAGLYGLDDPTKLEHSGIVTAKIVRLPAKEEAS